MRTSFWRRGLSLIVLMVLIACGQPQQPGTSSGTQPQTETQPGAAEQSGTGVAGLSHGGPVVDHVTLVDQLRAQGLTVEPTGEVEQPFLRGRGTILRISGDAVQQPADLQSYDYNDTDFEGQGAAAAAADAQQIGPDGNPRTAMITWVEPPHFFRKERVLVLYVGSDPAVLNVLTELLGPQFAGR